MYKDVENAMTIVDGLEMMAHAAIQIIIKDVVFHGGAADLLELRKNTPLRDILTQLKPGRNVQEKEQIVRVICYD